MGKIIMYEEECQVVNPATGEVVRSKKTKSSKRVSSEPFFCTYINALPLLCGNSTFGAKMRVLFKLLEYEEYNTGMVYMTPSRVNEVMGDCNITQRTYYRIISSLKADNIIEGDKGVLRINVKMFWKGDRNKRNELMHSGIHTEYTHTPDYYTRNDMTEHA